MALGTLRCFFLVLVVWLSLLDLAVNAQCTDVHVVFARGSTEPQGLGICGKPLVSGIQSNLQGKSVSSHAVVYGALASQTSAGPGATAMTRHIVQYAAQCPNAVFVIGGYSQGGSVTDIAIGIKTALGTGETIPTTLAPRIKAIVVFGNPLKLFRQTIATASPLYGSKAIEYCNTGDPVCGNGANMLAHLTYATDGSVTKAAQRAAQLVGSAAPAVAPAAANQTTPAAPPAAPAAETPSSGGGGLIPGVGSDTASGSGIMSKLSGLFSSGGGLSGLFGGSGEGDGTSGISSLISGGGGGASSISNLFGGAGASGLSGLFRGRSADSTSDSDSGAPLSFNFANLRSNDDE